MLEHQKIDVGLITSVGILFFTNSVKVDYNHEQKPGSESPMLQHCKNSKHRLSLKVRATNAASRKPRPAVIDKIWEIATPAQSLQS